MTKEKQFMLVDDSEDMQILVPMFAKRCGLTCEIQPDAESAWRAVHDRVPELMLLDVNLPGQSGPEFCRQLREQTRFAPLRIAVFTHQHLEEDIVEGLRAGADFVVNKDLLKNCQAWKERMQGVFARPLRRCREPSEQVKGIRCDPEHLGGPSLHRMVRGLSQSQLEDVFQFRSFRLLGIELAQAILQRSLRRVESNSVHDERDLYRSFAALSPEQKPQFVETLLDEVWCVLGATACIEVQEELLTRGAAQE